MEENNKQYIEQILLIDQQSINREVGLMEAYGHRLDGQVNYYKHLPPKEKRRYEDAVIALSRAGEIDKARLGLSMCSEMADIFPAAWQDRVVDLVQSLVDAGLPLAGYQDAISYNVILLIRHFCIRSLIPFVRDYFHKISEALKIGKLEPGEWYSLFSEISRTLIALSPEDFWGEFHLFYQDNNLLDKIGERLFHVIRFWAHEGTRLYGLAWTKQLVEEHIKIPDRTIKYDLKQMTGNLSKFSNVSKPTIKAIAYAVINDDVRYWGGMSRESRVGHVKKPWSDKEYDVFLIWLRKHVNYEQLVEDNNQVKWK